MPAKSPSKKMASAAEKVRSAGGRPPRPFKVDGKLLKALDKVSASQPVVVTMKLRREGAKFAAFPMSNDRGNPRAQAFADEVEALIGGAGEQGKRVRVVQRAANLGVATVEAPASVVKHLVGSAQGKLETLDLARDGSVVRP